MGVVGGVFGARELTQKQAQDLAAKAAAAKAAVEEAQAEPAEPAEPWIVGYLRHTCVTPGFGLETLLSQVVKRCFRKREIETELSFNLDGLQTLCIYQNQPKKRRQQNNLERL